MNRLAVTALLAIRTYAHFEYFTSTEDVLLVYMLSVKSPPKTFRLLSLPPSRWQWNYDFQYFSDCAVLKTLWLF